MTALQDKKAVMIIASQNFRDEELFKPKEILEAKGVQVTIAASSLAKSQGMLGGEAVPQILLGDVQVRDFDAVIFVGGTGANEYFDNITAHTLAKEALSLKKVLAAICIALVTLAKAGVLNNRRATVFQSEVTTLTNLGIECTRDNVTVDGNIITAAGPFAAEEFGKAIVEALVNTG